MLKVMAASKGKVLVVDDNEQKRYTIVRYLKAAGFETIETDSGEEALRLAEDGASVIALDVNLPDVIGYEVARRLRQNPKTASIPIVHISATFTTPASKAQGLESGADSFLSGPVEREELVATMNAMIRMRQSESIARDLAAQWQATFDAITDAVVLVNPDGIIERCNRGFAELVKQEAGTIVGRNLTEIAGPSSVDQSVYFRMLGSRRRESIERCVNNLWFCITADPVINPEGEFKGGVLIISDISDRKRAEEVRQREQTLLQRQAEQLEAAVFERTRQLEESVKSMEGFCYSIAHDLRAPLRAMSGLTTVLIEDYSPELDEEGRSVGDRITAAAKRMDRLIEELLAFGRLSNRELPLRAVDVAGAFKVAMHHLSAEIADSQAQIDLKGPLGVVWANPTVVEQIASNLLGNALKFVGAGRTPMIRVWAEERGGDLRVWVEDNGIGISPAYHHKIFGLFERLHTDKQYRGTGIGLAIVQKGVERLGGKVGVESEHGKGSRFWIELPREEKS